MGNMCQTPVDLINRWATFFGAMEGGTRMTCDDYRASWLGHLQERQNQVAQSIELHTLPSLTELEAAFRRVQRGKATGSE